MLSDFLISLPYLKIIKKYLLKQKNYSRGFGIATIYFYNFIRAGFKWKVTGE